MQFNFIIDNDFALLDHPNFGIEYHVIDWQYWDSIDNIYAVYLCANIFYNRSVDLATTVPNVMLKIFLLYIPRVALIMVQPGRNVHEEY